MDNLTRKEAVNWWFNLSEEEKTATIENNYGIRKAAQPLSPYQIELLHAEVLLREKENEAWELMDKSSLTMNHAHNICATFTQFNKNEYPFIEMKCSAGEIEYYYSSIREIEQYNFFTKEEVILANAIFEQTKNEFNPNQFVQQLKFVFRILNIKSIWIE